MVERQRQPQDDLLRAGARRTPSVHAGQADLLGVVGGLVQKVGLLECTPLPSAWASKVIGPGVINVGPHSLTVPAGALKGWVTITASSPSDEVNRVDFEPTGLRFKRSVSITISYANCDLLGLPLPKHVAHIDDDLNILSLLPSVDDLLRQKVTGKTDHFSEYAVAW